MMLKNQAQPEPTPLALQFAEEIKGTLNELETASGTGQETLPSPID
jgi:hypothetical protein